MVGFTNGMARLCVVVAAAAALTGCVSFRPLEPVIAPPVNFRGDTLVPIEFVNPGAIGLRCAQRGAKFLGLPGVNSNACSSPDLVTMPNPCQTFTGGEFAAVLCRGLARANGWTVADEQPEALSPLQKVSFKPGEPLGERPPSRFQTDTTIAVEFVSSANVAMRCAERGAKMFDDGEGLSACADRDLITMPNPCVVTVSGWYTDTMCHEMAHANGWPPNHRAGKLFDAGQHSPMPAPLPIETPLLVVAVRDSTAIVAEISGQGAVEAKADGELAGSAPADGSLAWFVDPNDVHNMPEPYLVSAADDADPWSRLF